MLNESGFNPKSAHYKVSPVGKISDFIFLTVKAHFVIRAPSKL